MRWHYGSKKRSRSPVFSWDQERYCPKMLPSLSNLSHFGTSSRTIIPNTLRQFPETWRRRFRCGCFRRYSRRHWWRRSRRPCRSCVCACRRAWPWYLQSILRRRRCGRGDRIGGSERGVKTSVFNYAVKIWHSQCIDIQIFLLSL